MSQQEKIFKREPFQFNARANWQDGQLQTVVGFVVPDHKRLVIENISGTIECAMEQEITSIQVYTSVNGVEAWHSLYFPKTANFESKLDIYAGCQQVRIYADPDTTVNILVHKNIPRSSFPNGTTLVFISGYLISADSPSLAP